MKNLLLIMMLFFARDVNAEIYVNQNNANSVEYTDTPSSNSKQIDVPPINTISNPKATPQQQNIPTKTAATNIDGASSSGQAYKSFAISSPKDGETIQNQPIISVEMTVEPAILPGDKIQLMLDGKKAGTPTATIYQELGMVERGTHSLYATIINKSDVVIKQSNTITIYVHRNSINTSPASQNLPPVNMENLQFRGTIFSDLKTE